MSWASKYIDRYIAKKVAKHGIRGTVIWFIEKLVKLTPSKKDDDMLERIKSAMKAF